VKQILSNFAFDPHPQPLSQRERGEKTQKFLSSPSPVRKGAGGEVKYIEIQGKETSFNIVLECYLFTVVYLIAISGSQKYISIVNPISYFSFYVNIDVKRN